MGYDAIIRDGISLINNETSSLQDVVVHYPWIGDGTFGKILASGVSRNALVEPMHKLVHSDQGDVVIKAKILILEVVAANGAAGRIEPIDPRDEFGLPDGTRGPIVNMPGLTDKVSHRPYFAEIFIGE